MNKKLKPINTEIRQNMARAFFASAWADQCDESENSQLIAGVEIMDVMPDELDPAALQAASELEQGLLSDNRQFACLAGILDYLQTIVPLGGDRKRTAETLGHYLAMQAMGHGVGLYDAFGKVAYEEIRVPNVEFGAHSLDREYFTGACNG